MKRIAPHWNASLSSHHYALAVIFIGGAILRFFQLGKADFWLDEAGVAYAARAATLPEMLQVVRSHVMAMPLDYLIVWCFGRFNTQEAFLRLPAAIWGTLSLLAAYRLFHRFVPKSAALFGTLFLALSPLHIQYSQELRFYASLVFFYLISSLFLWRALEQPSPKRWALFSAVCITGIFFHSYVMLALANGFIWLALKPGLLRSASIRMGMLLSAVACLLAFLAGYVLFSASNFFVIPLMVYEDSAAGALATGLGWLPYLPGGPRLSWVWGGLCALLEITAVIGVLRSQPRSPLAGLFYSMVLQIGFILLSDIVEHYFFAPRQLLMLLPLFLLFAGLGAQRIGELLSRALREFANPERLWIRPGTAFLITASVIILASLPALHEYYQDDKGTTRVISQLIFDQWQPGDSVLVAPAYDGFVYKYYIEYEYQRADIAARLFSADWDNLAETNTWRGNIFLTTPLRLSTDQANLLAEFGFQPVYSSLPQSRYARRLWVRNSSDNK